MKTTVVIPNYNGAEYLEACLSSLEGAGRGEYDVIVVDNGSTDGSPEQAADRFPWLKLVRFQENRGFCAAVNEGIQRARTPYVLLLNNDTLIRPHAVEALERRLDEDTSLFSVSSRMVQMKNPEVMDGAGDRYNALGWAFAVGKGRPAASYDRPAEVFSSCAGAAIYRKDVLSRIGLFDEEHFAYLEDVDLGYRARIYGYRNAYEPAAVVLHAGSGSSGSRYNPFKISWSGRNNIYLIYKNMPLLQLLFNLPLLLAGFLVKFLFFLLKGYGMVYLKALGAGFRLCASARAREHKVRFRPAHLGNYLKIEGALLVNIFRRR